MANNIATNKFIVNVAKGAAYCAPYLTAGANSSFQDQMVGKQAGESYDFVVTQVGTASYSDDGMVSNSDTTDVTHSKVTLKVGNSHIGVELKALEKSCEMRGEDLAAAQVGKDLVAKLVSEIGARDVGVLEAAGNMVVGNNYKAFTRAASVLRSKFQGEHVYAFIDPILFGELAGDGRNSQPVSVDPKLGMGAKGQFLNVDDAYSIGVLPYMDTTSTLTAKLTISSTTDAEGQKHGVVVTEASKSFVGKKGLILKVAGYGYVMLTDDVNATTGGETISSKVALLSGYPASAVTGAASLLNGMAASKTYAGAIIRLEGAQGKGDVKDIDADDIATVEGITVHYSKREGKARGKKHHYDIVGAYGIVDPRRATAVWIEC